MADTNIFTTVTVTGSQAMARPDGAAIRLLMKEGTIVFSVDQRAIDALRRDLAAAERHLRSLKRKPNA